ncbi:hypothetical protein MHYP_G00100350 [Metynnis hypsauchen]
MSLTVSLLVLIFISGVVAQDGWAVNYNSKSLCALRGSALTMECTYILPSGHSVQKAFWTKELVTSASEPPDLSDDPEYRGRVLYLGDKHSDCTLRFNTVREKDQSKYYFTFTTDQPGGKYQGEGGVDLSVTDLQVGVPERVIEGDKVTLTCKTTCSLTVRPTVTWYRNGHRLSSSTDQLHLQPVSREDAGRYHCAVLGQNLRSPEVTLNVRYGPKNVLASISPSGEIVEGSSVTLTCSCDANPPVENYTWFKEGGSSPVGSGHRYSFIFDSKSIGWYYCLALNEHGSAKSAAMLVNSKAECSTSLYVVVGVGLCGIAAFNVVFVLMCWIKKKKRTMKENDHQNVDPNAEDDTYTALDPVSRSSDDVYNTLANVDLNAKEDTYTALDPVSRSSDDMYNTLAWCRNLEVGRQHIEGVSTAEKEAIIGWRELQAVFQDAEKHWKQLEEHTDQLHLQPVSREDAGRYRCAVRGQNLRSPEVTLNVRFGPENISVSINLSGETAEGSSVILTCSSDANPPVEYNWFKGTSLVSKGETYTMKKISSVDSGEYKCRSSNEHGEKLSEALTLNVLYPPKNISVSISPSDEIVESNSETLTCSSDANPPVQNYTWFKEGGSSPVGSGHSYRALQSGFYYCVAQNEHGSQKSAAVSVTVKAEQAMTLYVVVGVGLCGAAVFIAIILLICRRKKKKRTMEEDDHQNVDPNAKDDTYTALDPVSRSSDDVYNTLQ